MTVAWRYGSIIRVKWFPIADDQDYNTARQDPTAPRIVGVLLSSIESRRRSDGDTDCHTVHDSGPAENAVTV